MKTKIQFMLIVFLCGLAINLSAQKGSGKSFSAEDIAKKETEMMTKNLSLTSDQQTKVEALNLKYAQQGEAAMQKMKSGQKPTEEQKSQYKEEFKKTEDAKEAELKEILTTDQYNKYLSNKGDLAKRMDKQKGNHH